MNICLKCGNRNVAGNVCSRCGTQIQMPNMMNRTTNNNSQQFKEPQSFQSAKKNSTNSKIDKRWIVAIIAVIAIIVTTIIIVIANSGNKYEGVWVSDGEEQYIRIKENYVEFIKKKEDGKLKVTDSLGAQIEGDELIATDGEHTCIFKRNGRQLNMVIQKIYNSKAKQYTLSYYGNYNSIDIGNDE